MIRAAVRQRALGEFLRKHRELVAKAADDKQVGERRRRTSGLRREEVAQMAGISATWYTRLEQGKEVTPSGAALGRIADVLQLVPAERAYLFHVARRVDPNEASISVDEDRLVSKAIENFVLSISYPAYLLDKYWTPLFWNAGVADLFPLWLKSHEKNVLRYMFLDPSARTLVADWESRVRHLLARFRVDYGRYIDDPNMLELVRGLSEESEFFRKAWREQEVLFWGGSEKSYCHPRSGSHLYLQTAFMVAADPALKLVVLQPCK
jgi:transcriptional regulator with XRE-family HTH domain